MEKHLHIVCLDTPYPTDYGGAFDSFYTLKWLHQMGIRVHLHCFEYGRGRQPELERYSEWVHYYPRKEGLKGFSFRLPYIVSSRADRALIDRLREDDYPVLLEGIHCTFFLQEGELQKRKTILRLHNVEWIYYRELFNSSHSPIKKLYYAAESLLLKKYEREIAPKSHVLTVSEQDAITYRSLQPGVRADYLPVFVPWNEVSSKEGMGSFCLYHGNLSVPENERAAEWLMEKVFSHTDIPFVIAGKNPTPRLLRLAERRQHTCLVANPSAAEMNDLVEKAHIHILPSLNSTGIKLKLLHALFCGRHCVANDQMVSGTGLEAACHIAGNAEGFQSIIYQLYRRHFSEEEIRLRQKLLLGHFNNEENMRKLISWIW